MNLENLTQFDKRRFKKLLGLYVHDTRVKLQWSIEHLAGLLEMAPAEIRKIEAGQKSLNQSEFESLSYVMALDSTELNNIAKITQVQNLMSVYKEISEHFPK